MTNEQILKACIEKAVEGGWKFKITHPAIHCLDLVRTGYYIKILFDHSFCKAFWGEEKVCNYCGGGNLEENDYEGLFECLDCDCSPSYTQPKWHYHGKLMFLAEDRLKYMEQFIK